MNNFEHAVMEKHAKMLTKITDFIKNLAPIKSYNATKNSPSFKVKKAVGKGLIGLGIGGYGLHKITQGPELVQNTLPGIPPHMQ